VLLSTPSLSAIVLLSTPLLSELSAAHRPTCLIAVDPPTAIHLLFLVIVLHSAENQLPSHLSQIFTHLPD
jgi:hypothetical protein